MVNKRLVDDIKVVCSQVTVHEGAKVVDSSDGNQTESHNRLLGKKN